MSEGESVLLPFAAPRRANRDITEGVAKMLGGMVTADGIMKKVLMATRDEDTRVALAELKEKAGADMRAVAAACLEPLMAVSCPEQSPARRLTEPGRSLLRRSPLTPKLETPNRQSPIPKPQRRILSSQALTLNSKPPPFPKTRESFLNL